MTEPIDQSADDATFDDLSAEGLRFEVAASLAQVIAAWELVYTAYRRAGLVEANPYHLHTSPHMISEHTAVIIASIHQLPISTLTTTIDYERLPGTLPLDRVFEAELNDLRAGGARLLEIGLFADRRKHLARSAESLFELMRYAFFFGMHHDVTDFLIGVHPRHTKFYIRAFGFEPVGDVKEYAAVKNHPVVLMRGEVAKGLARTNLAPAVKYAFENPVPAETYEHRFRLRPEAIAGSPVMAFLNHKRSDNRMSKAG